MEQAGHKVAALASAKTVASALALLDDVVIHFPALFMAGDDLGLYARYQGSDAQL